VFREGCISGVLDGREATENNVMELMAISSAADLKRSAAL
jgi:hypothetical protein